MINCVMTIVFLITYWGFITTVLPSSKMNSLADLNPILHASFEKHIAPDYPTNLKFKRYGGKITKNGVSGNALRLNKNEYLTVEISDVLRPLNGSISFWARPHWSSKDNKSHTFVSFSWMDERKSYFVISKGWWEQHGGTPYTYLIFNDQDGVKSDKLISFTKNKWVHIACTWKFGMNGFLKFYINGYPASESLRSVQKAFIPFGKLYIGTDAGTPLRANRWADSDFDDIAIFSRALSDAEIISIYNMNNPIKNDQLKKINKLDRETRAILDEGSGWHSEKEAERIIERIKKAGFNVYIPCVWHGAGTRFPSEYAATESGATFKVDPLKRLIEIAHRNGIEVHAWFTIALRSRNFYSEFYGYGTPPRAFDVHRPAFRKFIVNLITDTANRYNLDGVLLDYIRTMGNCTCSYCRNDYYLKFKRNLLDDVAKSMGERNEIHLQNWHDQAITAIVSDVRDKLKYTKPNIILSAYGSLQNSPDLEGRQLLSWANTNLIDTVLNGDYKKVPDYEHANYILSLFNDPEKFIIMPANYVITTNGNPVSREGTEIANIMMTLNQRFPEQGKALYIYSLLSDAQIVSISQGPFKEIRIPKWSRSQVNANR